MTTNNHKPRAAAAGMPEAVLRVDDLRVYFDTARGAVRAVDGVSLELMPGETLGIVGESGSGKSVLARTLMGLSDSSAARFPTGRVIYKGQNILGAGRRELRQLWQHEMSMVFQNPMTALNPVMRVGRQLEEAYLHLRLSRTERSARAIELLRSVGIPEPARRARQYPHEMSGGMRQRVVIAIALASDPEVLFADEPTTALDVTVQAQILQLFEAQQRERHMAQVLISHDLGVMAGRADRIAVMYAGRIVETAPTEELFAAPRMPYTRALLAAIPTLDGAPHQRLSAIGGHPPDMVNPPAGCSFAPRCPHRTDLCTAERPQLEYVSPTGHSYACFHPAQPSAPSIEHPMMGSHDIGGTA